MRRWNTVPAIAILLPPSLVLGFYAYIGSFNRMLGDDYCSVYIGRRLGLFRSIWYWYRTWHGGFSASALDWFPSFLGIGAFRFHTLFFLSIWLVSAAIAIKKALHWRGYSPPGFFPALLAVLLVFTTLGLSPDLSQSLFWWGGARGYLSPLIFFTLYLAIFFLFITLSPSQPQAAIWSLISFGIVFFTGGFSETFTPVMVVLFAGIIGMGWIFYNFRLKDPVSLFLLAGLAGAVLALLVMVLAPGNASRQTFFPVPPDLITILRVSFTGYVGFLAGILNTYRMLGVLGSVGCAIWLGMLTKKGADALPVRGQWILAFLLAGFVLSFGCFPPAVFGTSEPPPPRTLIVPSFLLVTCLLTSGFLFGMWLEDRVTRKREFVFALSLLACSLIIISSWKAFQGTYTLRDQYISFARQWDFVDAQIRAARNAGDQEVRIPPMKNWAGLEYPTDNRKYWPNICYSSYYDIDVLSSPSQP